MKTAKRILPTPQYLKENFTYDSFTGVLKNRICRGRNAKKGNPAGTQSKNRYRRVVIDGKIYYTHKIIWFMVMGKWPAGDVDHKNGVVWDNRINNLREATRRENAINGKIRITNKTGIRGVYWSKSNKKWCAWIRISGQNKHLGYFKEMEDAVITRNNAEIEIYGEFRATLRSVNDMGGAC